MKQKSVLKELRDMTLDRSLTGASFKAIMEAIKMIENKELERYIKKLKKRVYVS